MDFLENVKRALNDTVKTVSKASGDAVEKVKIKYSIYDMNSEIKSLLGEIGLEIYESYKNGTAELNDTVLEKCREIDSKNERIEAAEAELDNKKNVTNCPECGEKIVKGANVLFCSKCGSKLNESEDGVTVTITED